MDMLENMRAFAAVAKSGSFTSAAEALDLATSIVTKRVSQLERSVGTKLLHRTTRKVTLSAAGEHHLARIKAAISLHDETLAAIRKGVHRLEGSIRIKVPSTLGFARLSGLIRQFAQAHPDIDVEVLLLDGPMNPAAEGVDIAVTAFPASFDGVADEFLWPIARALYASPAYLSERGSLTHPRELEEHNCVVYQPTGPSWSFLSNMGIVTVTVRPRLSSNDMFMLLEAVKDGAGIGLLSRYIALPAIEAGSLVAVLPEFPVPDLWVKAMVPIDRRHLPRIGALLDFLRANNVDKASEMAPQPAKGRKPKKTAPDQREMLLMPVSGKREGKSKEAKRPSHQRKAR
jgi:DNA-binding transcriptional LysR family regulator